MTYTQNFSLTASASTGPAAPSYASGTDVAGNAFNYTTCVFNADFLNASEVTATTDGSVTANFYNMHGASYSVANSICTMTTDPSAAANGGGGGSAMNSGVFASGRCAVSRPTAHAVPNGYGLEFQYGYFEAYVKFDPTVSSSSGYPTFFMFGDQTQGGSANFLEIDCMEVSNQSTYCAIHAWTGSGGAHYSPNANPTPALSNLNMSTWNRFGYLWTPGSIQFFYNGVGGPVINLTVAQPVNYANSSGPSNNTFSGPSGTTVGDLSFGTGVNWTYQVDWVRVWQ